MTFPRSVPAPGWLLRWKRRPPAVPPCPERPVCLIGDVHGRLDLLHDLLDRIAACPDADTARIVVLGDMIDRGPDSAGVLTVLHELQLRAPGRVICLMGNHERMLLDFLTSPDLGGRWLRHGGCETLASFGIDPEAADRMATAQALERRLGPELRTWLTGLPLSWQEGSLAASHAGGDPRRPLALQDETDLLWGHRDFARRPRPDGLWMVHGHVVVPEPEIAPGRIAVDTGAWSSGRLSAVWLDGTGARFLEASA